MSDSAIKRTVLRARSVIGALFIPRAERRPCVRAVNILVFQIVEGNGHSQHGGERHEILSDVSVHERAVIRAQFAITLYTLLPASAVAVSRGTNHVDGHVLSVRYKSA